VKRRFGKSSLSILLILFVALLAGFSNGCEDPPATRGELDAMSALQSVHGHVVDDAKGHGVKVDFKGTDVTDAQLAPIAELPLLEFVNLDATPITDAGLAHLEGLKNLKKLSLRQTKVTDAGLSHLQRLPSLDELDLEYLPITDAGLAELAPIKCLRKLYVSRSGVTSAGVDALKAANPAVKVSLK
jgi:hypothetical protein